MFKEQNTAAKLWLHSELIYYLVTLPYSLVVENKIILIQKDEEEPLNSQRTFDECASEEMISYSRAYEA